jgi:hypothetical protein
MKLRDLADKGNIVARLPGVHLVPQIRQKLGKARLLEGRFILVLPLTIDSL